MKMIKIPFLRRNSSIMKSMKIYMLPIFFWRYSVLLSLFLLGACASVPDYPAGGVAGLIVYRQSTFVGAARNVQVELNGKAATVGPGGFISMQPVEGINEFKRHAIATHYVVGSGLDKTSPTNDFIERYFFEYRAGDYLRIAVAPISKSIFEIKLGDKFTSKEVYQTREDLFSKINLPGNQQPAKISQNVIGSQVDKLLSGIGGESGRVALVIGNANYSRSPLVNPANDADDMGGLYDLWDST
jgi:hypothetical protein